MSEPSGRARRLVVDTVRRGWFEAKTVVAQYPSLAIPIARRRHGFPVGDDTQIVIEGFPRTGTSFAVVAFDLANQGRVVVACHVHAPAQVIEGARRGLPNLVVAREPEDTVVSFVIRNQHFSVPQALRGYLRFYEPLLRYRDRFVAATFEQVTDDFGAVTRRVNERFGTSFAVFEHNEANEKRCFEIIDEDYQKRVPQGEALERQVARPSEWRNRMKEGVRARFRATDASALLSKAERAFRAFADAAGA